MESERIEIRSGQPKKVKRWGYVLMVPLLASVIVLCFIALHWRHSLKVQNIIVDGTHIVPAQQIVERAKISLQSSLDTVDLFAARGRILQQPFVRSARLNIRYPDAVHIQIAEREPIASLNTGQLRYIDRYAFLLPQIESPVKLDLPIISGVDSLKQSKVGDIILNAELSQAIELLQTAQAVDSMLYHSISEINMNSGKDIILYSTDVGVPIIVGRGEFEKKLITLQAFWSNFVKSQNAEQLQYVDLRFSDQVVVRWKIDPQQVKTTL